MKLSSRKTFLIFYLVINSGTILAQPFSYSLKETYVDSASAARITYYDIIQNNLKTGTIKLLKHNFSADILLTDATQKWLVVGDNTNGFKVLSAQNPDKMISLPPGFEPNSIRYSYSKNKIFVFGDNSDDDSLSTKSLYVFNVETGQEEVNLKLPESTEDDYSPFLSSNSNELLFTIDDSTGVEFNDNSTVAIYSNLTNKITDKIILKNIGYPNAGYYTMQRGRKGKGILLSYYRAQKNKYYQVYDFEKRTSSPFIFNTGEADAYLLGDSCQYLTLVEKKKIITEYHDSFDVPSGIVKIFDVNNGTLLKILQYPEIQSIIVFDEFPNEIYPLGVTSNGVVQKFSIDSLKVK